MKNPLWTEKFEAGKRKCCEKVSSDKVRGEASAERRKSRRNLRKFSDPRRERRNFSRPIDIDAFHIFYHSSLRPSRKCGENLIGREGIFGAQVS